VDGNARFNEFLSAVLECEIPLDDGARFRDPVPPSAPPPRRRPPATVTSTLTAVAAAGGTGSLRPAEIPLLESAAASLVPPPELVAVLRAEIGAFAYLRRLNAPVDAHLRDLSSGSARSSLVVNFLLVVLQHRRLAWIDGQTPLLLREYKRAVALRTIVDHYRPPRRGDEARELNQKIQLIETAIRDAKNAHEREYTRLIAHAAHFEITYQSFTNTRIDQLSALKMDWKRELDAAVLFSNPPAQSELELFRELQDIERELAEDVAAQFRELEAHRQRSRATANDRTAESAARDAARLFLNEEVPALRTELRNRRTVLRRRRRAIFREIPRRRQQRLAEFVAALNNGNFQQQSAEARNALLAELEPLIAGDTSRRLFPDDDAQRWGIYAVLLPHLRDGIARVSLEFLIDTFLVKYGSVNATRDIGLAKPYTGLTRRLHGESAIDIIVLPEVVDGERTPPPIQLLLPGSFAVPVRLTPGASAPCRCQWRRSSISPSAVRSTNDVQDIFSKIAFGLLRRQGGGRQGRGATTNPIAEAMDEERTDLEDRAPSWVCDRNTRRLDAPRVLAGLAMNNLTPIHNAGRFAAERQALLDTFTDAARERLDVEPDTSLFDEAARASRTAGIMHAIPNKYFGTFMQAAQRLLESGCDSPVSIVHRLWQFLRRLYREGGAEATVAGASVTVRHVYDPDGGGPAVIVDVFYTHMRSVNRGLTAGLEVTAPIPLGEVGLTGNAATPHLHMQITVREEAGSRDRTLGSIYPHEFFELGP
jgi:hypothetical protein